MNYLIDRWGFPIRDRAGNYIPKPPLVRKPPSRAQKFRASLTQKLRRLHAKMKPGQSYTQNELARLCDVDATTIGAIERSALRKLRRAGFPSLKEITEGIALGKIS